MLIVSKSVDEFDDYIVKKKKILIKKGYVVEKKNALNCSHYCILLLDIFIEVNQTEMALNNRNGSFVDAV